MQTYQQIRALLEKYYNGLTSLDEERTLRDFFASCDIDSPELPSDLRQAGAMFGYFARQSATGYHEEASCDIQPKRGRAIAGVRIAIAAAVAALLIAGAVFIQPHNDRKAFYAYIDGRRVTDPRQVMAEYDRIVSHVQQSVSYKRTPSRAIAKADSLFSKLDVVVKTNGKFDRAFQLLATTDNNQ